jgi:hypothetical protein
MIGKTIVKLLKANATLLTLVNTNSIFPYVAAVDTPLPFITYAITSIDIIYTKDGWANDIVTFTVSSAHTDYSSLQNIVNEIRKALEFIDDTNIQKIMLTGFKEGFDINWEAFGNELTFEVQVNSY